MTHFDTMNTIVNQFFDNLPKSYVAYCDYIAHTISKELKVNDTEKLLASVSKPQYDLTESGGFASTEGHQRGRPLRQEVPRDWRRSSEPEHLLETCKQ
jgi:hypothetical protein